MSEMIERVAKAIEAADVGYDINLVRMVEDETIYRVTFVGEKHEFPGYEEASDFVHSRKLIMKARAAITAMREVTEEMLNASKTADGYLDPSAGVHTDQWCAMINAVLEEK